jgi:RimJ/RimL family protein N-acetyltransferase
LPAIETQRLSLVAASNEVLRADLERAPHFGDMFGAEIPADWPPDPNYDADAIRYVIAMQERDAVSREWGFRYFVLKEPRLLIGAGGYAAPAANAEIEIGYSIMPALRRRGLASEATRAMTAHAFECLNIERVIAHTLPTLKPSMGVLRKCGFQRDGEGKDVGAVRYTITRAQWLALS